MTPYTRKSPVVDDHFAESRELFECLVCWLGGEESAGLDHAEVEETLAKDSEEVVRKLMQGHLDRRAAEEERRAAVMGSDGVERRYCREGETRGLETLFGRVTATRMAYETRSAGALMPLDAELGLPLDLYSHGVRRRVAEAAIQMSFDEAAASLARTTGARAPKRQAEELVRRAAANFEEFYERRSHAPQDPGDLLVLSADGKGVVVRRCDLRDDTRKKAEAEVGKRRKPRLGPGEKRHRKRMATVAAVYSVARNARTPEEVMGLAVPSPGVPSLASKRPKPRDKRTWASLRRDADYVMDDVFEEALHRDPKKRRTWVFLVDGDPHQLERIRDFSLLHEVKVTVVLDFAHVLEYLWNAAHCFHAAGSDEAEAWVTGRALEALRGKASEVARGMRQSATKQGLGSRKGVDACARYLLNHKEWLRYDEYLSRGFPIATGVIEGACRHLVKDRLEITGARWSLDGAEAVLQLRSLWASGDFDEYWRFHRARELERNHLARYAENPLRRAS
jgi:hypothetical protein